MPISSARHCTDSSTEIKISIARTIKHETASAIYNKYTSYFLNSCLQLSHVGTKVFRYLVTRMIERQPTVHESE